MAEQRKTEKTGKHGLNYRKRRLEGSFLNKKPYIRLQFTFYAKILLQNRWSPYTNAGVACPLASEITLRDRVAIYCVLLRKGH
jgi:hypothetical protein